MNDEAAMQALMNIEGFRTLNQDIETIINKSEAVKKARKEKNDETMSPQEKKQLTEEEKGKEKQMKCHVCGCDMNEEKSDMPFKISQHKVVIFKKLPVFQCVGCGEFLIADPVMVEVEALLEKSMPETELDVLRYADMKNG